MLDFNAGEKATLKRLNRYWQKGLKTDTFWQSSICGMKNSLFWYIFSCILYWSTSIISIATYIIVKSMPNPTMLNILIAKYILFQPIIIYVLSFTLISREKLNSILMTFSIGLAYITGNLEIYLESEEWKIPDFWLSVIFVIFGMIHLLLLLNPIFNIFSLLTFIQYVIGGIFLNDIRRADKAILYYENLKHLSKFLS